MMFEKYTTSNTYTHRRREISIPTKLTNKNWAYYRIAENKIDVIVGYRAKLWAMKF